jgi:uncharacterized protein YbjQ (UPF0145 family)
VLGVGKTILEVSVADCVECGKKFGFLEAGIGGRCTSCAYLATVDTATMKKIEKNHQDAEANRLISQEQSDRINSVLITTETAPNLNIIKRLDVVSAQAAFEINNFKDLFVGFMNPADGRSNELEKQLDGLRTKSTRNLKVKAYEIGANAIVAVDLDLSTVTIGGISMMMMMASGTAVVIEETDSASQT